VKSGYILARNALRIILAPEADEDLKRMEVRVRKAVKEAIEKHLRHEPARLSKSRIKRLRGLRRPQYRLRIGEVRIFYDVAEGSVQVLAIIPKSQAAAWLKEVGEPHEDSTTI
jgi:mRNA interferase RelE/StbE